MRRFEDREKIYIPFLGFCLVFDLDYAKGKKLAGWYRR